VSAYLIDSSVMTKARTTLGDGFGLSFLDILCCGLGAAILLLLIVKHELPGLGYDDWLLMLEPEIARLESALRELESEDQFLESKLVSLRERLKEITLQNSTYTANLSRQEKKLLNLKIELASEQAKLREIAKLQERLSNTVKVANTEAVSPTGPNFGALSGIQFGGDDKVVILLDSSASMIDWSVVEIIRTQASGVDAIEAAFKWKQARTIGKTAFSSISAGKRFKFLTYSEKTYDADGKVVRQFDSDGKVIGRAELQWDVKTENDDHRRLTNLNFMPQGGTNLKFALDSVSSLIPKPNRILIITDGLPNKIERRTLLRGCPKTLKKGAMRISATCRESVALNSIDKLSEKLSKVPIDIVLLPLEGDATAVRFYSLITSISSGRLITPAVDWLVDP